MRVQAFGDWLRDEGYPENQVDSHLNRCGRVELAETVNLGHFRLNEFMDGFVVNETGQSIRESIQTFNADVARDKLQEFITRAMQQWSPIQGLNGM